MGITEREKHIENLKTLVAFLEVNPIFKLSDEMYKSLDYAISSLKTDLKYDLMYEGEEVYTKADIVAMLEELKKEIEKLPTNIMSITDSSGLICYGHSEYEPTAKDASKIIQQKINSLKEGINNDN